MASRTRHSVTMKTVLVLKIKRMEIRRKRITVTRKQEFCSSSATFAKRKNSDRSHWTSYILVFVFTHDTQHNHFLSEPPHKELSTWTMYSWDIFCRLNSEEDTMNLPKKNPHPPSGVQIPLSCLQWTTILTTLPQLHSTTLPQLHSTTQKWMQSTYDVRDGDTKYD